MIGYIARRILVALPVLAGVLLVVFILVRILPGEPCSAILGERASPEACARFNEANGLDEPFPVQLALYAQRVVTGDFGESIRFSRPVSTILLERLPVTFELSVAALTLAVAVGIPLGILAARRHNTAVDVGAMAVANVGVSMPIFWLGLLLAYVFAITLGNTPFALPPSGRMPAGMRPEPFWEVWGWELEESGFAYSASFFISNMQIVNAFISAQWEALWAAIRHLILPTIALATIPMSIIARMTRSSLLDVLQRDYVRTARAKGAGERRVVRHHALRNALLPVVTVIGLQLGALLGGAVLTETVFGLSGIGTALYDAITTRDFPIIQGFTVVIAATYVVVNLLVDISYGYLDPRVRLR
ncbi:MAG TPA: ABC transporter permease [Acidimicrobiia bacterium]|nr:ABC transporter permease [Acidimicrobiia bacterium]